MARLFVDHNFSYRVASSSALARHDVLTARAADCEDQPDDAVLLWSVQTSRLLVTHNRKDFKLLHDAWLSWPAAFGIALPPHPGILVLDTSTPDVLARVLATFLDDGAHERLPNRIVWWHRHDGWRQPLARDR